MKIKKKSIENSKKSKTSPCLPDLTTYGGVHPVLKQYFGYCFSKAALKYKALLSDELGDHGIVSPQLGILKLLQVLGPVSQIALGQDMGIDKASMVKFLDGLENKKWIRRLPDAKDRRIKLIALTGQGENAIKKLTSLHQKVVDEFLGPLLPNEQELLKKLVSRLT